jgi:hypothetical protein
MSVFVDSFIDRLVARGLDDGQVAAAMVKAALLDPRLREEFDGSFADYGLTAPGNGAYEKTATLLKQSRGFHFTTPHVATPHVATPHAAPAPHAGPIVGPTGGAPVPFSPAQPAPHAIPLEAPKVTAPVAAEPAKAPVPAPPERVAPTAPVAESAPAPEAPRPSPEGMDMGLLATGKPTPPPEAPRRSLLGHMGDAAKWTGKATYNTLMHPGMLFTGATGEVVGRGLGLGAAGLAGLGLYNAGKNQASVATPEATATPAPAAPPTAPAAGAEDVAVPPPTPAAAPAPTADAGKAAPLPAPAGEGVPTEVPEAKNLDESLAAADRLSEIASQYTDQPEKLQELADPAAFKEYQTQINHNLGQIDQALKSGKLDGKTAAVQIEKLKNAGTTAAQAAAYGLTGQVVKVDVLRDELNKAQPGTPLHDAGIKSLQENNPKLLADLEAKFPGQPTGIMAGLENVWKSLDDPNVAGGWGKTLILGGIALSLLGLFSGGGMLPVLGGLGMAAAPFLSGLGSPGGVGSNPLISALGGLAGGAPKPLPGHTLTAPGAAPAAVPAAAGTSPVANEMMARLNARDTHGAMHLMQQQIAQNQKLRDGLKRLAWTTNPFTGKPTLGAGSIVEGSKNELGQPMLTQPMAQAILDNWDKVAPMLKNSNWNEGLTRPFAVAR